MDYLAYQELLKELIKPVERLADAVEELVLIESKKDTRPEGARPGFCGQTQPHKAHNWTATPNPVTALTMQCGGHI